MDTVGRVGNTLFNYHSGYVLLLETIIPEHSDIISFELVPVYSNIYFIELVVFGQSQYEEVIPVTKADISAFNNKLITDEQN